MDPIEVPLLGAMVVGLSFTFSNIFMVPPILHAARPPENEGPLVRERTCLFEPIAMMQTGLLPNPLESVGIVFLGAWSSVHKEDYTVHFSFGRTVTTLPSVEFTEHCFRGLCELSYKSLWSVSCFSSQLGAGLSALNFHFASPAAVQEHRYQVEGVIACVVDMIAVYPLPGKKLRKAS